MLLHLPIIILNLPASHGYRRRRPAISTSPGSVKPKAVPKRRAKVRDDEMHAAISFRRSGYN